VISEPRASPSLQRVATSSGLVLLDGTANRLWAYNDSAQEIWDLIHAGRPEPAVADEIAARYGLGREVALHDIRRIIEDWREKGLMQTAGGSHPRANVSPVRPMADWTRGPRPDWAASLTCTIRRRVIAFHVEPSRARSFLEILYAHLATPDARPDATIELRDAGAGETALVVDGVERLRSSEGGELIGGVNQAVLELVNPGTEWLAMIHGGAVARHGRGIGLPAACGSGKTTLVAHLLPRGWNYLADDLIALAAPTGRIVPLPLPLSVKEGSWDVLAGLYPDFMQARRYETARGSSRQLAPPLDAWDRDPVPLQAFVFPRYTAGAATTLTPISPLEALQRLLSDRIWLGYPLNQHRVEAFIAWLDDRPAYDLVHGNATEAARRIEEIA
jgi:hypothetical protein